MMEQEVVGAIDGSESGADGASPSVGVLLMQARVARGLSLSDVAQRLKLGERQIEAMESESWDELPGATLIRGFVRNYARLLELDPSALMLHLDNVLAKPVSSLAVPEMRPVQQARLGGGKRDRMVVFAALAFLLAAAALYFLMPNDLSALRDGAKDLLDSVSRKEAAIAPAAETAGQASEPVLPPGATPQQVLNPQAVPAAELPVLAPIAAPVTPPLAAPSSGAAPSVAAQLRFLADKESWVEVRDRDNKVIFSQRLTVGGEQSVNGQGPLSLVIGYAPGIRLFWRGQAIDLGPHTRGDVARLVLE